MLNAKWTRISSSRSKPRPVTHRNGTSPKTVLTLDCEAWPVSSARRWARRPRLSPCRAALRRLSKPDAADIRSDQNSGLRQIHELQAVYRADALRVQLSADGNRPI